MAVYVDDAVTLWRGRPRRTANACSSSSVSAIRCAQRWPRRAFQNKTSGAHYDVPAPMREQAIALGAVAISRHVDRARVRAVIANAKAQGRGERN